jgi:hypothetical protein
LQPFNAPHSRISWHQTARLINFKKNPENTMKRKNQSEKAGRRVSADLPQFEILQRLPQEPAIPPQRSSDEIRDL